MIKIRAVICGQEFVAEGESEEYLDKFYGIFIENALLIQQSELAELRQMIQIKMDRIDQRLRKLRENK